MKKAIKVIIAAVAVLALCMGLFCGCADNGSIVGRWEVSAIKMGNIEMESSALEAYGVDGMAMEFKADGTVDGYTNGEFAGSKNYTISGSTVTIDGSATATIQDGRLYLSAEGTTVVFSKK